jgi:hypothetical protein
MISPDAAADLRAERRFDLVAALLIGVIAMLAAVLAVIQIETAQASGRAQVEAARLTADISARLEVSTTAQSQVVVEQQEALALAIQGTDRAIAGLQHDDNGTIAVGEAEHQAGADLGSALTATSATSGGAPLDSYTSGLLTATMQQLVAEVNEQNRQVDLANDAGARNSKSILGLSFLALAGVLTGLAAVLREGRAGWIALLAAVAMAGAAGLTAVLALI